MKILLAALSAVILVSSARADALSELRRLAGTIQDDAKIASPSAKEIEQIKAALAEPKVVRVDSTTWNDRFPLAKATVAAIGAKVGAKEFEKFSCEWTEGAATVRCDYAYNVWPEICWYGYDHVVADIATSVATKAPGVEITYSEKASDKKDVTTVLKEWRAN